MNKIYLDDDDEYNYDETNNYNDDYNNDESSDDIPNYTDKKRRNDFKFVILTISSMIIIRFTLKLGYSYFL